MSACRSWRGDRKTGDKAALYCRLRASLVRSSHWKLAAVLAIILATIAWLAVTGIRDSKSYYVTVSELEKMPGAHARRLRVAGDVVAGSIQRRSGETDFVLQQGGKTLAVAYVGSDPLPDTFVDHAQAVASGRWRPDGSFRATGVQAKCASKYEPKGARAAGRMARTSAGSM